GVAVANIYYNQPMLADIGRDLHADPHRTGLIATVTQLGYAAGMPVFIPLGDFVNRRNLVVALFAAVACALAAAALSPNLTWIVAASFCIGLTTVLAQILIPLATELAPPAEQGRTIGAILTGVLLGILLARTVSGIVAEHFGWRIMFWAAAGGAVLFAIILRTRLPEMKPHAHITYPELMRSMWTLLVELPKLRQVSLVAAMFFACFSAFWTTLVFLLQTPPYHYGAQAAGLFGLIGATGASVAGISGRMSDRRSPRFVISIALAVVFLSFAVFWAVPFHLSGLIAGVVLLDAGVQGAQVANQTRVLSLRPEARNRVNTIYMISYFGGGSIGSLFGSYFWSRWGWNGVCAAGFGFLLVAVIAVLSRGPGPVSAPVRKSA
ncbi:MAG: MFS transporter, partial [Acidobacteriaceae bacterium]|nr:MFS transporter [Acidobacteriaceae bacterium]